MFYALFQLRSHLPKNSLLVLVTFIVLKDLNVLRIFQSETRNPKHDSFLSALVVSDWCLKLFPFLKTKEKTTKKSFFQLDQQWDKGEGQHFFALTSLMARNLIICFDLIKNSLFNILSEPLWVPQQSYI